MGEYDVIRMMMGSEEYQLPQPNGSVHIDAHKMRADINDLFHGGREVRTLNGMRCMFRRVRKQEKGK